MGVLIFRRNNKLFLPPEGMELDLDSPLTQKLLAAFPMNQNGGLTLQDAGPRSLNLTGSNTATPTFLPGPFGNVITGNGTTSIFKSASFSGGIFTGDLSITCWVYRTGVGGSSSGTIIDGWNGTAESFSLAWQNSIGNVSFFMTATDASQTNVSFNANTVSTNKWVFICATYSSATKAVKMYYGELGHYAGDDTGSPFTTATAGDNTTTQFAVASDVVTDGDGWAGRIGPLYLYNRVLAPVEVQQLWAEPYAPLAPLPSRLWASNPITIVTVAGATYSSSEADQANTPRLTQTLADSTLTSNETATAGTMAQALTLIDATIASSETDQSGTPGQLPVITGITSATSEADQAGAFAQSPRVTGAALASNETESAGQLAQTTALVATTVASSEVDQASAWSLSGVSATGATLPSNETGEVSTPGQSLTLGDTTVASSQIQSAGAVAQSLGLNAAVAPSSEADQVNALAFTLGATGAARTSEETESAGAPGQGPILAGATPGSSQIQSAGTLAQTTTLNSATASSGETAQVQASSFTQVATGAAVGSNEVASAGVPTSGVSIYTIYGAAAGSQETEGAAQLTQAMNAAQAATGASSETETAATPGFSPVTVSGATGINEAASMAAMPGLGQVIPASTAPTGQSSSAGSSNQTLQGSGVTSQSNETPGAVAGQIIYIIAGATSSELAISGPATPGLTHRFNGTSAGSESVGLPGAVSSQIQTAIVIYGATFPSSETLLPGSIVSSGGSTAPFTPVGIVTVGPHVAGRTTLSHAEGKVIPQHVTGTAAGGAHITGTATMDPHVAGETAINHRVAGKTTVDNHVAGETEVGPHIKGKVS
jgi:hypothetical protein